MHHPESLAGFDPLADARLSFRQDSRVSEHQLAPLDEDLLRAHASIDRRTLRRYRLERIRAQLVEHDYAGVLLADPINIRYATDTNNLGLWVMHSPSRYVLVTTNGPVILFDFTSSKHNSAHIETIDEIRPATPWLYFLAGPRVEEKATSWAHEVAELLLHHGGGNRRLAVDRCDPWGATKLVDLGVSLHDAQPLMEQARLIKSAEELASHRVSMGVCDLAIARMRTSLRPGITENQLWSILHGTNVAHGGEWAESRLLSSGQRTNPWFQDATDKPIQAGEMVCFDTDMVGPGGYLSDISRSFVCPGQPATARQRDLLRTAAEQLTQNINLLRPGLGFREFAERCWPVPERYRHNRYMMMLHGVGLVDEYPSVAYATDFVDWGYDGTFAENMVVSVESFIGEQGGPDGVKLEEQVVITAAGAVKLSRTPLLDPDLH